MKRLLQFVLLILVVQPLYAQGSTYYVDNCMVTGTDTNNGTSPTTPWLTVAKVNGISFNPGDTILFQGGCTWREQLIPKLPALRAVRSRSALTAPDRLPSMAAR